MHKRMICVPMIALCLLLTGCGGGKDGGAGEAARTAYQDMTGCTMEATVTCSYGDTEKEFTLKCDYVPDGTSTVEVLAPETVAGVKAEISGDTLSLSYEGDCLNAGTLSSEDVSPADCLPWLIKALRDGWLLEQNKEDWGDVPCLRLALDQTGNNGGKVLSTLWLRQDDGTPVRGEISVDGQIILTAEFTSFQFHDILSHSGAASESAGG